MEPVFLLLGQSAAAGVLAVNGKTSVQAVGYPTLRTRLLADRQNLDWTPAPTKQERVSDPSSSST